MSTTRGAGLVFSEEGIWGGEKGGFFGVSGVLIIRQIGPILHTPRMRPGGGSS